MTQKEFADELSVGQAAVSLYESGKRSPSVHTLSEAAQRHGRQLILAPSSIEAPWSRSEQFSRLLYLEVAQHFLSDPDRVRSIAIRNLDQQDDPHQANYTAEWRQLIKPGHEVALLMVLTIPDRDTTGLLASSPFAGVIDDETRQRLLNEARRIFDAE